jgi:hypothetical protein
MYELIDPLAVTGATIDNVTGASSSPNIRRVNALDFLSFEGLGILPNGVTYHGDELSAGSGAAGYQPHRGNWIIEEDGSTGDFIDGSRNNDIWDCLDDGADDDTLSDGCVRIATLNDLDAESTGGFFDPTGTHYYVSIQHNSSGFGTILDITGWGSQGPGS